MMNNILARLLLVFYLLSVHVALAQSNDVIDMAVGWHKPPYVMAESNSGFELELVRTVFQSMGYSTSAIFVPYGRSHSMLKSGLVDIVLTVNRSVGIAPTHLSEVYVTYQNVALSLKKSQLDIYHIEDLAKYSIVSFQNATMILGQDYANAIAQSPLYIELPEQRRQVELLLLGNTQAVVMDINIFSSLSKELTGKNTLDQVHVHDLFAPNPYRIGFKDQALKRKFNQALGAYLGSENHLELLQKYDFYLSHKLPFPTTDALVKNSSNKKG